MDPLAWAKAAAAYLVTDHLAVMIALAAALGVVSAIMGHVAAISVPAAFGYGSTNTAGMMAFVSGLILLAAGLFSSQYGLLSRIRSRGIMRRSF